METKAIVSPGLEARFGAQPEPKSLSGDAVQTAILSLLCRYGLKPGDYINLVAAEAELTRAGFGKNEFCRGIVQLLERGLFTMAANSFYLTAAGSAALPRSAPPPLPAEADIL